MRGWWDRTSPTPIEAGRFAGDGAIGWKVSDNEFKLRMICCYLHGYVVFFTPKKSRR